MGNSSSKDNPQPLRGPMFGHERPPTTPHPLSSSRRQRDTARAPAAAPAGDGRSLRPSRHEIPFLGIGREREGGHAVVERTRETKQDREARKVERERQLRLKERERSVREEHVDGGYLVTLGTYTGPEDFSKPVVRQLQIERRLAPFWNGLDEHSDSWTEAQLVAAARNAPIPLADQAPAPAMRANSYASTDNPSTPGINVNNLTVPMGSRSRSYEAPATGWGARPSLAGFGSPSPSGPSGSTAQLFRGRAKTLASLATGSRSRSPDLTAGEIKLPKDHTVNGQPLEAFLYKDAAECPICFLYYPPYLNRTRCCDQPICSECFVQIKRPDPHPPEHEQPDQPRPPPGEAGMLVSEVASCPFCVTPEFGVTYDPPPFRRGLAYHNAQHPLKHPSSAMSSTSSLAAAAHRRRAMSLSANAPQVVTTDRIRPDWARKLAEARAHALRRSAAATALHNAAYLFGNQRDLRGGMAFGRRRRTLTADGSDEGLMLQGQSDNGIPQDLYPMRSSSRRTHVEDLENLMMMEAIRLSLAVEEDRKRKEEKELRRDVKKRVKEEKKEAKQAERATRRCASGSSHHAGADHQACMCANAESSTTARSTTSSAPPANPTGNAPRLDLAGLDSPTQLGLNLLTGPLAQSSAEGASSPSPHFASPSLDPQRHLEESRASLHTTSANLPSGPAASQRQTSNASSVASSVAESSHGGTASAAASAIDFSPPETPPEQTDTGSANGDSLFNFRSLAAVIGQDDASGDASTHLRHLGADVEVVPSAAPTTPHRVREDPGPMADRPDVKNPEKVDVTDAGADRVI